MLKVGKDLLRAMLQVVLFTALFFKLSVKKHSIEKILQTIWKASLNESTYNFCKFSYKFAFIPLLSIRKIPKQAPVFQPVGDLVTKHFSVFIL